jgi:DUF4097 and DUF4098 domain-containing protein YvlB
LPLLAGVFAIAPSASAAFNFGVSDVVERRIPLASGGTVTLTNVNGSVHIEGWEGSSVEVRAVKTAHVSPRDLSRVHVLIDSAPNRVNIRTEYPAGESLEVSVDYRIRVPYRSLLSRVETVNGSIRIHGLESSGTLRSVNGNVEVFDTAGRFNARTTNGNVRMELRDLPEGDPVELLSVNGSVILALPTDADAELDIRSLNGDFASDLPLLRKSAQGQREFHARLGRGGGEVRVRTVNGGIRVVEARPTI